MLSDARRLRCVCTGPGHCPRTVSPDKSLNISLVPCSHHVLRSSSVSPSTQLRERKDMVRFEVIYTSVWTWKWSIASGSVQFPATRTTQTRDVQVCCILSLTKCEEILLSEVDWFYAERSPNRRKPKGLLCRNVKVKNTSSELVHFHLFAYFLVR
jgi:hypothetical protein